MPPLPVLPGGDVVKALEKLGFEAIRVKGSHPGRDIPVGTPRRIIRDTGLSIEQFVAAL